MLIPKHTVYEGILNGISGGTTIRSTGGGTSTWMVPLREALWPVDAIRRPEGAPLGRATRAAVPTGGIPSVCFHSRAGSGRYARGFNLTHVLTQRWQRPALDADEARSQAKPTRGFEPRTPSLRVKE